MRFFYFFLVLFLATIFFVVFKENKKFIYYKVNNKTYKLLIADTKDEWQKGLMFYKNKKELKGADGMIFIFPDKAYRSFWNKNTYLDLDIYWIDDDRVIGKDYLPSILITRDPYTISSKEKVNRVVELIR